VRYLLLICGGDDAAEHAANPVMVTRCKEWAEDMERRGIQVQGQGLRPPNEATTVRVRDGEVLLSDGPFAETKEMIGGFSLLECADLDEAIEVTASHPWAEFGTIEVRPLWES
jgi:hypothetical protein